MKVLWQPLVDGLGPGKMIWKQYIYRANMVIFFIAAMQHIALTPFRLCEGIVHVGPDQTAHISRSSLDILKVEQRTLYQHWIAWMVQAS